MGIQCSPNVSTSNRTKTIIIRAGEKIKLKNLYLRPPYSLNPKVAVNFVVSWAFLVAGLVVGDYRFYVLN